MSEYEDDFGNQRRLPSPRRRVSRSPRLASAPEIPVSKLRNIGSSLSIASPKLAYAQGDQRAADRAREQLAPWRAWYRTPRWQRLRLQVFLRDGYLCQRSGVLCIGKHPAPNSPVANHKTPHKGDPALFWDINNIETVTKLVHDTIIQAEERANG